LSRFAAVGFRRFQGFGNGSANALLGVAVDVDGDVFGHLVEKPEGCTARDGEGIGGFSFLAFAGKTAARNSGLMQRADAAPDAGRRWALDTGGGRTQHLPATPKTPLRLAGL
jgi:hypothetical protein